MKKMMLYIVTVLFITATTIGSTYAWFASSKTQNLTNNTNSKNFEVIYNGGTNIDIDDMPLVSNYTAGANTSVNIKISADSVAAKANLFINISNISTNLAKDGFNWKVIGIKNDAEVLNNSGHFAMCKTGSTNRACVAGDKLYIVNNYVLSTDNTVFTIYLWLDGEKFGNEVIGTTFSGSIGANTENYTGELN